MQQIEFLEKLKDGDVIIWGARMTGMGVLRQLRANNIYPVCFIDSDKAFHSARPGGLRVFHPKEISHEIARCKWVPKILVAASLKEAEILSSLKKYELDQYFHLTYLNTAEPFFTIDIVSSCNLKCLSCPHSIIDHDIHRGMMTYETFEKVLDKILLESPSMSHLSLYSWGEPLLHPHIDKIVRLVQSKNISVALSTNLSLQFDRRIEKLIQANPDYLKISVSGYYPDAYNKTHQGGDINLVKSNLYRLRYLLDKYKSTTLVDINYHLYRDNNKKNLLKFKELSRELKFMISTTYALVMPLERVLNHLERKVDMQTKILSENLLVTIDEGIEASSSKRETKSNECAFRENQIIINADLTVPVCCTVFHRQNNIVANNFLNASLSEISDNKQKIKTCSKCQNYNLPEYNMGLNKEKWDYYASQKKSLDS